MTPTRLRAPAPHSETLECWCHPEIVQRGYHQGVVLAALVHNDLLGTAFGLYAASRVWDSKGQREEA